MPTEFGSENFYAFQDKYLFSGYKETDLLTADGSFKKILDSSFDEMKSLRDTVFGFQDYSAFFSKDLEQWTKLDFLESPTFFHGKVQVIKNKLVNLSGGRYGNLSPEIIDVYHKKRLKLDIKGVMTSYNSYGNSNDIPKTTAIVEYKGKVYLFTSTGIYSKSSEYLFEIGK